MLKYSEKIIIDHIIHYLSINNFSFQLLYSLTANNIFHDNDLLRSHKIQILLTQSLYDQEAISLQRNLNHLSPFVNLLLFDSH